MEFFADLEGSQQVPPLRTSASGKATFQSNGTSRQITYRLTLRNIQRVFAAHIHLGRPGQNGPIIAPMLNVTPSISLSQGQVMGTITQSDLTGPLEGQTIEDLIDEMEAGNTYVNAHTEQNPNGEIRGQIRRTDR
jgi:hypothetical protein